MVAGSNPVTPIPHSQKLLQMDNFNTTKNEVVQRTFDIEESILEGINTILAPKYDAETLLSQSDEWVQAEYKHPTGLCIYIDLEKLDNQTEYEKQT